MGGIQVSPTPKRSFLSPIKSVNGNRSERRQCHFRPHTGFLGLKEVSLSPDIIYSSFCDHLCITNSPRILGITESKSNSQILGKPTSSQIERAPLYEVLPPWLWIRQCLDFKPVLKFPSHGALFSLHGCGGRWRVRTPRSQGAQAPFYLLKWLKTILIDSQTPWPAKLTHKFENFNHFGLSIFIKKIMAMD